MMETIAVMERRCKEAFSYEKKKNGGKSGRSSRRLERIERSWLYVIRYRITISMEKLAGAAAVGVGGSFTTSFASG